MNERLQELDKSAQEYAGRVVGNDEDSNYNEWLNVYKERFAWLIVNQAALQCRSNDDMDRIFEHFGVN